MKPGKTVPEDYGMKSYVLQSIDALPGRDWKRILSGCRVLVWKDGLPVYDKGFGTHLDKGYHYCPFFDLFDLASLTKTTATLLAVMKLYDEGKIKLDDKVSAYLPFLRNGNKRNITIRELLFHESGLPSLYPLLPGHHRPNSVHGPPSQSWVDEWHRTQVSEHSYYCSDFKFRKGMVSDKNTPAYTLHGRWHVAEQEFQEFYPSADSQVRVGWQTLCLQRPRLRAVAAGSGEGDGAADGFVLAREFYAPMGLQRTMFLPLTKFTKAKSCPRHPMTSCVARIYADMCMTRRCLHGWGVR